MNIFIRLLKWWYGPPFPELKTDVIFGPPDPPSLDITADFSFFEYVLNVCLDENGDYVHIVDNSDCNAKPQIYTLHIGPKFCPNPDITVENHLVSF
ncbi:hypothetical protein MITS9504_01282 [Synechococcus sp. MIT S9504]|nr:hypothetical protein MITS9504_01282 [Synechococcus sp. MIT S9504]